MCHLFHLTCGTEDRGCHPARNGGHHRSWGLKGTRCLKWKSFHFQDTRGGCTCLRLSQNVQVCTCICAYGARGQHSVSFVLKIILLYVWGVLPTLCLCTMCMPGAQGGQKGASDSLQLELLMVWAIEWAPTIEPRFSGRTASAVNWWVFSPAPLVFFFLRHCLLCVLRPRCKGPGSEISLVSLLSSQYTARCSGQVVGPVNPQLN